MAGKKADDVLRSLEEQRSKFQFMENNMLQRRTQLQSKLPEIEKALENVEYLLAHKVRLRCALVRHHAARSCCLFFGSRAQDDDEPVEAKFELSDTLFATAKITKPKTVCLWLGVRQSLAIPALIHV